MATNSTNEDSYRLRRNDSGTQVSTDRQGDSLCHRHAETVAGGAAPADTVECAGAVSYTHLTLPTT